MVKGSGVQKLERYKAEQQEAEKEWSEMNTILAYGKRQPFSHLYALYVQTLFRILDLRLEFVRYGYRLAIKYLYLIKSGILMKELLDEVDPFKGLRQSPFCMELRLDVSLKRKNNLSTKVCYEKKNYDRILYFSICRP